MMPDTTRLSGAQPPPLHHPAARTPPGPLPLFVCPETDCGARLGSEGARIRHLRFVHRQERPWPCFHEGCGKRFSSKTHLRFHLRVHSKEKPFVCAHEGCGKRFSHAFNLKTHGRLHTGERPFACPHEECPKRFRQRMHLICHMARHTKQQTFVCPEPGCARQYKSQTRMAHHLLRHRNIRPFACQYGDCDRTFTTRTDLSSHVRTHVGATPFACSRKNCKKRFSQHSQLVIHQRTHARNRPFNCPYELCTKRFRSRQLRDSHLAVHRPLSLALAPTEQHSRTQGLPGPCVLPCEPEAARARRMTLSLPPDERTHRCGGAQVAGIHNPLHPERALAQASRAGMSDPARSGPGMPVSPRLPPVPLSPDCLIWLAQQTVPDRTSAHHLPGEPDPGTTFWHWLRSPAPDMDSTPPAPGSQQTPAAQPSPLPPDRNS